MIGLYRRHQRIVRRALVRRYWRARGQGPLVSRTLMRTWIIWSKQGVMPRWARRQVC